MNCFIINKLNNYFNDYNMDELVYEIHNYYKYNKMNMNSNKRIKYSNPVNINYIINDINYNLNCLDGEFKGDYDMLFDIDEFVYKLNQIQ